MRISAIFPHAPHPPPERPKITPETVFGEKSEHAPTGSSERQLYQELAAEEREHADLLTTELDRWQQGKPGLL